MTLITTDPVFVRARRKLPADAFDLRQEAIVKHALQHGFFATYGWSCPSLARGWREVDAPEPVVQLRNDMHDLPQDPNQAVVPLLFPNAQPEDLLVICHRLRCREMLDTVQRDPVFLAKRTPEKILQALWAYLEPWQEARASLLAATATMAAHPALTAKHSWQVCDLIWTLAGDTSADYNHYTKRSLLLAVLAATIPVWLSDNSDGQTMSYAYLTRRLYQTSAFGQALGARKAALESFGQRFGQRSREISPRKELRRTVRLIMAWFDARGAA